MTTTVTCPPGYELTMWTRDGARQPMFIRTGRTCRLPGGLTGYYMRPGGACLAAAASTCLQIPLEEMPDSLTDAGSLMQWSEGRGLRLHFHQKSGPRPPGLAIGVSPPVKGATPGGPHRHTIVLKDGRNFFDPAQCFLWPDGRPPAAIKTVDYAMSFTAKEEI